MVYSNPTRMRAIIFITVAVFFCLFTGTAQAEEQASVDDLFILFLDNWLKPFVAASDTADYDQSGMAQVNDEFLEKVKKASREYGHLPEYWEMRAFIDLREEDKDRGYPYTTWALANFTAPYYMEMQINPKMLKRAVRIDGTRDAAFMNIGLAEGQDILDEINWDYSIPKPLEYWKTMGEWYAKASEADPHNAYHKWMQFCAATRIGEFNEAVEFLRKTSICSKYEYPLLFPSSYIVDQMCIFKEEFGVFENLSYEERRFIIEHYLYTPVAPHIMELRQGFRSTVEYVSESDDWKETFNLFQRAAVKMCQCESGDSLTQLCGLRLLGNLLQSAREYAIENDENDMKLALLAMFHEVESVKLALQLDIRLKERNAVFMRPILETLMSDDMFKSSDSMMGDFARHYGDLGEDEEFPIDLDMILTDTLFNSIEIDNDQVFNNKFLWHRFERIKSFDYTNPGKWFDWWDAGRTDIEPKDPTSYREDCST